MGRNSDGVIWLIYNKAQLNDNVDILASFFEFFFIRIGKGLTLSLPFPLVHTVHATFTAYGVPTNPIHSFLCI